jgi:hypothetical protein
MTATSISIPTNHSTGIEAAIPLTEYLLINGALQFSDDPANGFHSSHHFRKLARHKDSW